MTLLDDIAGARRGSVRSQTLGEGVMPPSRPVGKDVACISDMQ